MGSVEKTDLHVDYQQGSSSWGVHQPHATRIAGLGRDPAEGDLTQSCRSGAYPPHRQHQESHRHPSHDPEFDPLEGPEPFRRLPLNDFAQVVIQETSGPVRLRASIGNLAADCLRLVEIVGMPDGVDIAVSGRARSALEQPILWRVRSWTARPHQERRLAGTIWPYQGCNPAGRELEG